MSLTYLFVATALLAADPETLPAPREVIVAPAVPSYYRRSRYDVWQYYSPGQQGEWLPRVDQVPGYGYFYMYNGEPYLYAPMYQRWVRPSIQGTPYRSPEPMMPVEVILPAEAAAKPAPALKPVLTAKAKPVVAPAPERMPYCED